MTQTLRPPVIKSSELVAEPTITEDYTPQPLDPDSKLLVERLQAELLNLVPKKTRRSVQKKQVRTLPDITSKIYFTSEKMTLYKGDALEVMKGLETASVDCIVTSPPYYGQRDYEVVGQLGLEGHPQQFIDNLVAVFREAKRVLKPTGSLWVNIGDTYWSGKGKAHSEDAKQKNRRFNRPQDKAGPRPWCSPKQLLLIPHRFAIAMQDDGWIVRNDNVWLKPAPTPDPVADRCALSHEYVFHFVKGRKYYFDKEAVAVPSNGKRKTKTPPSVWTVSTQPTHGKNHKAVFPEELVRLPILATCPPDGTLLDPFCGSGTTFVTAFKSNLGKTFIGIDLHYKSLDEVTTSVTTFFRSIHTSQNQ